MAMQRRLFRVEEVGRGTPVRVSTGQDDAALRHSEIMEQFRALRSLLRAQRPENDELQLLRAQIAEAQKLKDELDLIYNAINSTKLELATIHAGSFEGRDMARLAEELGAVIGGTEKATQEILNAAEHIDEMATTLSAALKNDHELHLAQDIQEQIIKIFEACNFQDIAGQRITKVMATMKFIEEHVVRMMEIWGGMEALAEFMPERPKNVRMVNGPRLVHDAGHASQDEIDNLFG